MHPAESSMGEEADECFRLEEEVCNFMPFELSFSRGEMWYRPSVFWSKQDDELQSIVRSSFPGADISTSQNKRIKEKIKVFLQKVVLKCFSCSNCLIQFWAPMRIADKIYLSTADQPFALQRLNKGLHKGLCSYRRECLENILIPVDVDQLGGEEYTVGPPGRVFRHGSPELCGDIRYYLSNEYVGLDRALQLGLRSYMAFPLFESAGQHCIGVLEAVSTLSEELHQMAWNSFFLSMQLKEMDLEFGRYPLPHNIDTLKAENKAVQIMEDTCRRHQIPLALMWFSHSNTTFLERVYKLDSYPKHWFNYLPVCEGQGVVGKAFSSQSACFCKDVSKLSISVYPLVTFARQRGLSGCFAICLKSTQVDLFYVLEFFLSRSGTDFGDPRTFVTKLVTGLKKDIRKSKNFLQKIEKRLFVEVIKISDQDDLDSFEIYANRWRPSVSKHPGSEMMQHDSLHQQVGVTNHARSNSCAKQIDVLGSTQLEGRLIEQVNTPREPLMEPDITIKERNITSEMQCDVEIPTRVKGAIRTVDDERGITREVLQQHSGEKLKDAAKKLGVSRSTLKRICRKHKIYRWPPNRSNRPIHQDSICPANENTDAHTMPSTSTMQECSNILVKVTCVADVWKFHLSLSAKKIDLEQQVAIRLYSSASSFKIKYLDDENEWISISCDEDLKFCIETCRSQGETIINMLIEN